MRISGPKGLIRLFPSCLRAVWELALARLRHLSISPSDIARLNEEASRLERVINGAAQDYTKGSQHAEHVSFVIPRVAARLPWRADCLIQALAAQRWLMSRGVETQITIGVDREKEGKVLAHAWLKHGKIIVTGGEISRFSPLLSPDNKQ